MGYTRIERMVLLGLLHGTGMSSTAAQISPVGLHRAPIACDGRISWWSCLRWWPVSFSWLEERLEPIPESCWLEGHCGHATVRLCGPQQWLHAAGLAVRVPPTSCVSRDCEN